MELKYNKLAKLTRQYTRSNRTFMELKSCFPFQSENDSESSNRTFMELK